jgi:hypothetical protein
MILLTHVSMLILFTYALYQQEVKGIQFGDKPAPNWVLILLIFTLAIVLCGLLLMKLEVWIDQEGVHYQFFPIIWKKKLITKLEIQRYEIRKYNAILDYGGRGIRWGIGHKWGRAYMVSGNTGLQLYLTNGKKVLFGTERPQAIIFAIDEMMKSRN